MRSLIVYYSYTGNTKKVAEGLQKILAGKGQADIFRIEAEDESDNFFIQCIRAATKKRAAIKRTPLDVGGYDVICIGTPVWAFAPAPAINSYMDGLKNIKGKDTISFATYGSGVGVEKCFNLMKKALKDKDSFSQHSFKVQQMKADDEQYIKEAAEKVIRKVF